VEGKLGKSRTSRISAFIIFSIILLGLSCSGPESDQPLLTAELPLHLEEHINDAIIEGSEVGKNLLTPVEWRFDEPQPDWKAAGPIFSEEGVVRLVLIDISLRDFIIRNPSLKKYHEWSEFS
jgi:hypothetical protein